MSDPPGTVYVIVASEGEYSEREEWICGVYADKARAIALAEEHGREVRAGKAKYYGWETCYERVLGRGLNRGAPSDAEMTLVNDKCGPQPPWMGDIHYYVSEVPMETWGKWDPVTERA